MENDKYVVLSKPYSLLSDQLQRLNAELERYRGLSDSLQVKFCFSSSFIHYNLLYILMLPNPNQFLDLGRTYIYSFFCVGLLDYIEIEIELHRLLFSQLLHPK